MPPRGMPQRNGRALALATAIVVGAVSLASAPQVCAAPTSPGAPASRYASIVIEAETGAVLYERNADLPRYPASLTKVMTLYLTFEALAAGKLKLGDLLTMSAHAAGQDPSRLDLAPGSKIRVKDAVRAMTTKSANDAACAIAERLGNGSEERFAARMTAKAKALGLEHTTFRNASGLPGDGHVSTARDLALICQALVRDFPDQYRYFATPNFEFRGRRYPNQNRFLDTYQGADGIKTGFVNASGHNLAASAVRGGKRLIAIVLGGDSQAWTRQHATRLLDVSYAKIDPTLVMVASNATAPPTENEAAQVAIVADATQVAEVPESPQPRGSAPELAPAAAAPATTVTAPRYATPAGAVTISRDDALGAPSATTNVVAFASAQPAAPSRSKARQAAANPSTTQKADSAAAESPASAGPSSPSKPSPQAGLRQPRPGHDWSVQVGLFRDATVARRRGEEARRLMPLSLRGADLVVGRAQDGVHVTSRISSLTEKDARAACNELQRGRFPCVVVPPGRPLVVATN